MRIKHIPAAISAVMLVVLYILAMASKSQRYDNLLFVRPVGAIATGTDIQQIERICDDEFLMTYEIRGGAQAFATNASHAVTLVGTNSHYPGVLGYGMMSGGFFTKTAFDAKDKHVTLNETAAFALFGSNDITGLTLKINGENRIVTGVIQDNDAENSNIYAPARGEERADTFVVLMGGDISEAYVKNTLKSIGINENNREFQNLSKVSGAFYERFTAAWKTAVCVAIAFLIARGLRALKELLSVCKRELSRVYLHELVARRGIVLLLTVVVCLFLAACTALMVFMLPQIFGICLSLLDLRTTTANLTGGNFAERLLWLKNYHAVDTVLFAAFMCAAGVVVLQLLSGQAGRRAAGM